MLSQCFFVNWQVRKNKPSPQKIQIFTQFLKNTKRLQVPLLTAKIQKAKLVPGEKIETTKNNLFIVTTVEVQFQKQFLFILCVTCKYWERKVIFYCVTFMEKKYTVCEFPPLLLLSSQFIYKLPNAHIHTRKADIMRVCEAKGLIIKVF